MNKDESLIISNSENISCIKKENQIANKIKSKSNQNDSKGFSLFNLSNKIKSSESKLNQSKNNQNNSLDFIDHKNNKDLLNFPESDIDLTISEDFNTIDHKENQIIFNKIFYSNFLNYKDNTYQNPASIVLENNEDKKLNKKYIKNTKIYLNSPKNNEENIFELKKKFNHQNDCDFPNDKKYFIKLKTSIDYLKTYLEKKKISSNLNFSKSKTQDYNIDTKLNNRKLKGKFIDQKTILIQKQKNFRDLTKIKTKIKNSIFLNYKNSKTNNLYKTNEFCKEKFRTLFKKRLIYDSLSDEEFEDIFKKKFVLHPNSKFKIFIDFLVFVVVVYSIIFLPIKIITTEVKTFCSFFIEVVFDVIFIIDFITSFFIGFYDFEENYITKKSETIINYIRSYFFVDILSGFPFNSIHGHKSLFNNHMNVNFNKPMNNIFNNKIDYFLIYDISKIKNVCRFLRVLKLFKVISKNSFLLHISNKINLENTISGLKERLSYFFLYFLILSHILSCIYIFLGTITFPNWITNSNLQNSSFIDLYIASLYFNLASIFTIGYGDILSKNIYEKIYNILLMVVGIMMYSFAITYLSKIIQQRDEKTKDYVKRMEYLKDLSGKYRIQKKLVDKIARYFKHDKKKNKKDKNDLLQELPLNLRNDLIVCMYKNIIDNFIFFKNFNNLDFSIKAIICFKPICLIKNEVIVNEGDFLEEFLFVKKGVLSLEVKINKKEINKIFKRLNLKNENGQNLKIIEIRKNEHFGDVLIFLNERSPLTVKTKTKFAELFLMKKIDLLNLIVEYQEIFQEIYSKSSYNFYKIKKFIETAKILNEKKINYENLNIETNLLNISETNSKEIIEQTKNFKKKKFEKLKSNRDNNKNNQINNIQIIEENEEENKLSEEISNRNSKYKSSSKNILRNSPFLDVEEIILKKKLTIKNLNDNLKIQNSCNQENEIIIKENLNKTNSESVESSVTEKLSKQEYLIKDHNLENEKLNQIEIMKDAYIEKKYKSDISNKINKKYKDNFIGDFKNNNCLKKLEKKRNSYLNEIEYKKYPISNIFNIDNKIQINKTGNLKINNFNEFNKEKSLNNSFNLRQLNSSNTISIENEPIYENPFISNDQKNKVLDNIIENQSQFTISTDSSSSKSNFIINKKIFDFNSFGISSDINLSIIPRYNKRNIKIKSSKINEISPNKSSLRSKDVKSISNLNISKLYTNDVDFEENYSQIDSKINTTIFNKKFNSFNEDDVRYIDKKSNIKRNNFKFKFEFPKYGIDEKIISEIKKDKCISQSNIPIPIKNINSIRDTYRKKLKFEDESIYLNHKQNEKRNCLDKKIETFLLNLKDEKKISNLNLKNKNIQIKSNKIDKGADIFNKVNDYIKISTSNIKNSRDFSYKIFNNLLKDNENLFLKNITQNLKSLDNIFNILKNIY